MGAREGMSDALQSFLTFAAGSITTLAGIWIIFRRKG